MEVRDWLHGAICIEPHEVPLVDSRFFQRLRNIRQLGFAENAFPNATHNRFLHSLGAMHTAGRIFDSIFSASPRTHGSDGELKRFRALVRMAALLHDIGHGPLSHTIETAMPDAGALGFNSGRQATHEDYTLKIILDSSLTPLVTQALSPWGWAPRDLVAVLKPVVAESGTGTASGSLEIQIDGKSISLLPLLHQMVSSELDCDRMDYLRRDSRQTGVQYGEFDFDWLLSNLTWHERDGKAHLGLHQRALYTFEDFLISRTHMFLMVYFHKKSVVYDSMLREYLQSPDCGYRLPSDMEAYLEYDDQHLFSHLRKNASGPRANPWATRIVQRKPFQVLLEEHTGLHGSESAPKLLERVEQALKRQGTVFLKETSKSALSKHIRNEPAIFVCTENYLNSEVLPENSDSRWQDLRDSTDLFDRYRETRCIHRIYVSPEELGGLKKSLNSLGDN